jgi:outer membrane lipoprotein-sorting protein
MKSLYPFLTLLLLLLALSPMPAQDAKEIVRRADEHARGKTSVAEMTITTVRPKWTRSLEMKVWMKGNDFALLLVQAPAKDKGIAYLKRKKEVWNWLPSLERTIKLPPSMMSQSWMGTDFTNDDLVKEASAVEDYTHKLLGSEKQLDRDCYKIEMIPKPEAAIVWSKVLVWIDKKDYLQLRTEFYDDSGDLVNTMTSSEIKTLGGRLLPTRMTMIPADKKGHKTEILYRSMTYDQPMNDSFFTTDNLSKVKSGK